MTTIDPLVALAKTTKQKFSCFDNLRLASSVNWHIQAHMQKYKMGSQKMMMWSR